MYWLFLFAAFGGGFATAQSEWIIGGHKSGIVEVIDTATLNAVARIQLDLPPNSVGLNGVYGSTDRKSIYFEGPIPAEPKGCCFLYSIDLTILQEKIAASISGTRSRDTIPLYIPVNITNRVVKPEKEGAPCQQSYVEASFVVGGNVIAWEQFGFKSDRRDSCIGYIPGGVTISEGGHVIGRVSRDLHFSELVPNSTGTQIYGVATEDSRWSSTVRLVRIDSRTGAIRAIRVLDPDYWRIAIAPLQSVPSGDVKAVWADSLP